jgi:hypothetical protein
MSNDKRSEANGIVRGLLDALDANGVIVIAERANGDLSLICGVDEKSILTDKMAQRIERWLEQIRNRVGAPVSAADAWVADLGEDPS